MEMKHLYRPDIDGLRAIAVGSVLIFHALPNWLAGGYVGVDIFFIISGYLITGILVRDVMADRFSVLEFYVRRARRLFPALLLMLAVVAAAGWWLMLPDEFALVGKHIAAGSFFVSNIALWREVGYFDVSSDLKPLLHLWSLGVEEQYYLVWPLLVFLLARRQQLFWLSAAALAIASFYLNVHWIAQHGSAVFYLPMTRFWELMGGSGLAMWQVRREQTRPGSPLLTPPLSNLAALAGLGLLAWSVLMFDRDTVFPGWHALLPALGSMALIAAGPAAWVNRHVLARPLMVWVGLISYPLYLWHWPLLAYARILLGAPLVPAVALSLLALALLLAWMTTHLVEARIRTPQRKHLAKRDAAALWGMLAAFGAAGTLAWLALVQPWSARLPAVRLYAAAVGDWVTPADRSIVGDSAETVLFMGDSHMQQYLPRVVELMGRHDRPVRSVQFATLGGCAPLRGLERRSTPCRQFVDAAFARARASTVSTVVLAASWYGMAMRDDYYLANDATRTPIAPFADEHSGLFEQWSRDLQALRQAGKRVVVLSSSPRGVLVDPRSSFDRSHLVWRELPVGPVSRPLLARESLKFDARVLAAARAAGAELLDPFDALCDASVCRPHASTGAPLFMDESHLRASYVREHVRLFDSLIYLNGDGEGDGAPHPVRNALR